MGYLLSYDSDLEMLRVEVPKPKISAAAGVGIFSSGVPARPVFGHEPVQHVPREMIQRIVFADEQHQYMNVTPEKAKK